MGIKADLRNVPHFFSLRDRKNAPSLRKVVEHWFKGDVDVVALTACHTATSGIDNRWEDYLEQARTLGSRFFLEYNEPNGFATVYSNAPENEGRFIKLVRSQQVRANYDDMPVDVNIVGASRIIKPTRPVIDTLKEAEDFGALRLACHISSRCGMSLTTAGRLFYRGLIEGAEIEAGASRRHNSHLIEELKRDSVPVVAVTGGHGYKSIGTSYIVLDSPVLDLGLFSIRGLKEAIFDCSFTSYSQGHISGWRRFMDRDRHICASMFGHVFSGIPERKDEFLKAVGLRRQK